MSGVESFHLRIASLLAPVVATLAVLAAVPAAAQEPCPTRPCVIDLATGDVAPSCRTDVIRFRHDLVDSNGNGYHEAVLKVDVDGLGQYECTCMTVVLEWDGPATGWNVNLCDSPGNDGNGGDADETDFEAELQMVDDELSVFGAYFADTDPPGVVERMWVQRVQADHGSMRFRVCDQMVGWGHPEGRLESDLSLKRLFYVPDAGASSEYDLYVGLNRVCDLNDGRDTGTVRRAYVALE